MKLYIFWSWNLLVRFDIRMYLHNELLSVPKFFYFWKNFSVISSSILFHFTGKSWNFLCGKIFNYEFKFLSTYMTISYFLVIHISVLFFFFRNLSILFKFSIFLFFTQNNCMIYLKYLARSSFIFLFYSLCYN